ncbi:MAG: hypothetical protein ACYDCK_14950, partial [Thermoplasmatota archaeon]
MFALVRREASRVLPIALVALAATTVLEVAAAYEANGFGGYLGPSSLDGAVATSRPELVLIPSLAGLVAGLGAFRAGDELVVAAVGRTPHIFGVA